MERYDRNDCPDCRSWGLWGMNGRMDKHCRLMGDFIVNERSNGDTLVDIYTRRQAGADGPLLALEGAAPSITPPVRTVVLPPS